MGVALPASYEIPTKPRTLSVNNTANLKSIRCVVLGKDGVGKSGMLKKTGVHACLPSLFMQEIFNEQRMYRTKRSPIHVIVISIVNSHVSLT